MNVIIAYFNNVSLYFYPCVFDVGQCGLNSCCATNIYVFLYSIYVYMMMMMSLMMNILMIYHCFIMSLYF